MASQMFRASVGLVVAGDDGRVVAVERYAHPGHWQLPQGGLDVGEEPVDGALRELWEELGLRPRHVEVLAEHREWLAYELPAELRSARTGRGQVQRWFLFRLVAPEAKIRLDHGQNHRELRAWEWRELPALAVDVAEFRRPVYRHLVESFSPLLRGLGGTPSPD